MAFQLPSLQSQVPIADPRTGLPTAYFTDWMNRMLAQIVAEEGAQDISIAQLLAMQAQTLAVQTQLLAALKATNTGAGGTQGAAQGVFDSLTTAAWTLGPVVSLAGVAAGHLTIFGSGPTPNPDTGINAFSGILGEFVGQWRIVEIVGFVETLVYGGGTPLGTFSAQRYRDDQGVENIFYSDDNTSQVSIARASVGAMDYRLDFRSPQCDVTGVTLFLNVARGP